METISNSSTEAQGQVMPLRFMHKQNNERKNAMTTRVLVVEDQQEIGELIALNLEALNYEVEHVRDGKAGLEMARSGEYDAIVLDIMLPELDGLEVCKTLRSESVFTPILMLTAKKSEADRVVGLEVGADDYLTKPFSVRELQARVKALLRRVSQFKEVKRDDDDDGDDRLVFENLSIDIQKREVDVEGKLVQLTAKEFDLLVYLSTFPGKVFTREQLLNSVWGYRHDSYEHTVNSHMNRLRSKIEADPANPKYVLTVWGVGYKFRDR